MSNDADLSTEDLARSGAGQERAAPETDERAFEHRSNVAAPGAVEDDAYAGATQIRGVPDAPMRDGGGPSDRDAGRPPVPGAVNAGADMALLDPTDGERFQQRWSDVQARFVDDPQGAVQTADGLVAELMQSLARGFSDHKVRLESAWQSGSDPDTEELRQALQRYRSFFNRLLST